MATGGEIHEGGVTCEAPEAENLEPGEIRGRKDPGENCLEVGSVPHKIGATVTRKPTFTKDPQRESLHQRKECWSYRTEGNVREANYL